MSLKIVRNDITRMNTDAIVNTANAYVTVGTGCDSAVYSAAGYDKLLAYRKEKIGEVPEGEAFITPGFDLPARYIIHAVSPRYSGGDKGEEEKLRSCYRRSLQLAKDYHLGSIAFPLISTGSFGYPKEEGLRIAVDEINAFLMDHEMEIYLVVFGKRMTELGGRLYPDLEEYIDQNYVDEKQKEEYRACSSDERIRKYSDEDRSVSMSFERPAPMSAASAPGNKRPRKSFFGGSIFKKEKKEAASLPDACASIAPDLSEEDTPALYFEDRHERRLEERMSHLSDTFSQYLMYLIQDKKMGNAEVYKRAVVDKKIFSKIKNNVDYHPQKLTALCLCVGAKLSLDESKDLLARAGYALSPCDKTDIIFSYFIENEIYDMIELDIQLEEHGLPCIIS